MLTIKHGDVFAELKPGDCLIHGVNCQGVMGSGIAKIVKEKWPYAFAAYQAVCLSTTDKKALLGKVIVVTGSHNMVLCNLISQENYGRDKDVVYVDCNAVNTGLRRIVKGAVANNARIVFPFIGGGLANGDRKVLLDIFHEVFDNAHIEAVLVINDKEEYDACMALEEARRKL